MFSRCIAAAQAVGTHSLRRAVARTTAGPAATARLLSTTAPAGGKIAAPPMVYIAGEEMTHYTMNLIMDSWITPHVDTSSWRFFDLSCKARDATEDQSLRDAVAAGKELCAIFKEPTVTPTEVQKQKLGLKKTWGSPNGAMRMGWNGITISRDTIHIPGMDLGFKEQVILERHAVGGEYSAGWANCGPGHVKTKFYPADGGDVVLVDERTLVDEGNCVVTYHNPLDNVVELAHHFFQRCLDLGLVPYIVTKKTVFKWQEGFWQRCLNVFNESYKAQFEEAGLLKDCGGELQHLISDAATMQVLRWTKGGFGMACHNYDGDVLSDEVAEIHRSPGFITSNLIGRREDGVMIKEFEASHGTVADMWEAHLRGEETSLNPLGMVEALVSAMQHAAALNPDSPDGEATAAFAAAVRRHMHEAMVEGNGTRDLCGPEGLTTEAFVAHIADKLQESSDEDEWKPATRVAPSADSRTTDKEMVRRMFNDLDVDGNGVIDFEEFQRGLARLGVMPQNYGFIPGKKA